MNKSEGKRQEEKRCWADLECLQESLSRQRAIRWLIIRRTGASPPNPRSLIFAAYLARCSDNPKPCRWKIATG